MSQENEPALARGRRAAGSGRLPGRRQHADRSVFGKHSITLTNSENRLMGNGQFFPQPQTCSIGDRYRNVAAGDGRRAAPNVQGIPDTDRPGCGRRPRPSVRGAGRRMRQATTARVRLDASKAARFSASAQSPGCFDRLLRTRRAFYRCPRRPNGRSCTPQPPGIREMSVQRTAFFQGAPVETTNWKRARDHHRKLTR
jgi:hypothetical protein